jgi:hypothetical protein
MPSHGAAPGIIVATAVAAAALLAPPSAIALDDCPVNHVYLTIYSPIETNAARFDSTVSRPNCSGHATYDLRTGGILAATSGGLWAYCGSAYVDVSDDFSLEGMPDAEPTDFQVVLRVHFNGNHAVSGYAQGSAEIQEGVRRSRVEYDPYVESADTLLRLSLRHAEGEVFRLSFRLSTSAGEASANIRARYEFEGLPRGTRVRSCQGFAELAELDANELRVLVPRAGFIAHDSGWGPGLEYPPGTGRHVVFAAGLWLSAWVNGELRMAVTDSRDEFAAGAIVNGQPEDPDLPANHVYSLYKTYTSARARDSSLAEYQREAVPRGAPPVDVLPTGELSIPNDQMLWHVYNAAHLGRHTAAAGSTAPIGVEIRQTAFAYTGSPALARNRRVLVRGREPRSAVAARCDRLVLGGRRFGQSRG